MEISCRVDQLITKFVKISTVCQSIVQIITFCSVIATCHVLKLLSMKEVLKVKRRQLISSKKCKINSYKITEECVYIYINQQVACIFSKKSYLTQFKFISKGASLV
jgi:hypothetical protein